ncbi:poly-beta-1,6-N-acetyl-D-glucosamine N-deacetylase PgaB, partial [Escherichia coli]|uniref:poly-beta-1,6-N-acetyl-D-glucosamine N-deacetylase PgaB n=1 Tax=Escherichia coli TaxID=562 RepID=UPI0021185056
LPAPPYSNIFPHHDALPIYQWLTQLTNQMKSIPQAKDKSILELQAQNWQKNGQHQAISSQQLAHWMSLLQLNGVKNY